MGFGFGLGFGLQRNPSGGAPSYDADAAAYFAAAGVTDPAKMAALSTFYASIKSGLGLTNFKDAFDYGYWRAGDSLSVALVDMTGNGFNGTAVNPVSHTAGQGVSSNGTTSYINNNFQPSTNGSAMQGGSASVFTYIRTLAAGAGSSSGAALGVNVTGNTFLFPHYTDNNPLWNINHNGGGVVGSGGSTQTGLFALDISGTAEKLYRDATNIASGTSAGVLPAGKIYSLCWNNGGVAQDFLSSGGIVAFELAGKHFTAAQHTTINNAIVALKASAAGW